MADLDFAAARVRRNIRRAAMARRQNVKPPGNTTDVPTLADVLAVLDEIGNAMAGIEVSEAKKKARQLARRLRAFGW